VLIDTTPSCRLIVSQCLPVIVALETSPAAVTSNRAVALHTILNAKHASLVNMRYIECARASFAYQETISSGQPVFGHRAHQTPIALLHSWYSLVREKRPVRQEFLKAIVRAFDVDVSQLSSTQHDINFARYMAENLAAMDYKTNEEVLTIIRHLTSILSVSGMQLVEIIAPSNLMKQLHDYGSMPMVSGLL
jgi:cohesin loading factor subunit SCC2